jgi:hypothetical protein
VEGHAEGKAIKIAPFFPSLLSPPPPCILLCAITMAVFNLECICYSIEHQQNNFCLLITNLHMIFCGCLVCRCGILTPGDGKGMKL